jgi:hypothetical protein
MDKVKVFRFRVSNWTTLSFDEDKKKLAHTEAQKELVSEDQIVEIINNFIADKQVKDIIITTIDVHYHNNGRSNTIDLMYTILYRETNQ